MIFRAIKYQSIPFVITGAGQTISANNVITDRNYKTVNGIQAITRDATAMSGLKVAKFEINGQEIYPADFDLQLISCGKDVNPNERFDKEVNEPADGSKVDISITDGFIIGQVYPYTVNIILRLSNPIK